MYTSLLVSEFKIAHPLIVVLFTFAPLLGWMIVLLPEWNSFAEKVLQYSVYVLPPHINHMLKARDNGTFLKSVRMSLDFVKEVFSNVFMDLKKFLILLVCGVFCRWKDNWSICFTRLEKRMKGAV
jgi:hypothetical protein